MKSILALIISVLIVSASLGQEMPGIVGSNYAGVLAIGLNPSSMVTSRLYMDYNLIGFQGFFSNNYMYLERDEFSQLLFNGVIPIYYTTENEVRNYAVNNDNSKKWGFQNLKVSGPGMIVKGKHAYGLTTTFRTISGFQGVPNDMAMFLYEAIDFEKQHNINYSHNQPIKTGSLSWLELGLSYAYIFHRYKWDYWSAGITIKPLFGTGGFQTTIHELDYVVRNDTLATVNNTTFEYGFSLPLNYNSNELQFSPLFRGYGLGVDAGVSFLKTRKGHGSYVFSSLCEQPYEAYNYKLGISVMDFGFIKFTKDAVYENYEGANTIWYKPTDVLPDSTINTIVAKVNYYFDQTNQSMEKKETFTMFLPPALSFQGDLWIDKNYYLTGLIIWGIPFQSNFINRPSFMAITPRYETARLEMSLPVSFYEWRFKDPSVGFSIRFGNVYAGIDRLNTLIGLDDFSGIDFYAGIRLNLSNAFKMNFIKGHCGMKRMRNIETFDYRNF